MGNDVTRHNETNSGEHVDEGQGVTNDTLPTWSVSHPPLFQLEYIDQNVLFVLIEKYSKNSHIKWLPKRFRWH